MFRINPPQLVQLPNGWFVLSGHRTRLLESSLIAAVEDGGGTMDHTSIPGAPDRIRIQGIDLQQASEVVRSVLERCGIQLTVVQDAAERMAAVLPPLSRVVEALPRRPLAGARSVSYWNPDLARWTAVDDTSRPGGYHLLTNPAMYVLRDEQDLENGTMVRCDARLVKHAAGARCGKPLIGYDSSSSTLFMPLGAELPLLYGRPAALAAGKLPIDDQKQRLVFYQSVTPALAATLADLLAT